MQQRRANLAMVRPALLHRTLYWYKLQPNLSRAADLDYLWGRGGGRNLWAGCRLRFASESDLVR